MAQYHQACSRHTESLHRDWLEVGSRLGKRVGVYGVATILRFMVERDREELLRMTPSPHSLYRGPK